MPGALLLGAYDWAAFGAPWRLSYRYVAPEFAKQQGSGFFGIGVPDPSGVFAVLAGNGGLLFVSPVLVLAAYGLVRLGRRFPVEAVVAGAIAFVMLLANVGYYLPYGGTSPGPRYAAPALPFLALGLAEAFRRLPRLTLALATLSVLTTTAIALTWSSGAVVMRNTVWGELVRLPSELGSSQFVRAIPPMLTGASDAGQAVGVTLLIALRGGRLRHRRARHAATRTRALRRSRGRLLAIGLAVAAFAAVDASAVLGFPYGNGYQPRRRRRASTSPARPRRRIRAAWSTTASTSRTRATCTTSRSVVLTLRLAPAMHLVGPPKVEQGNGCDGRHRDPLPARLPLAGPADERLVRRPVLGERPVAPARAGELERVPGAAGHGVRRPGRALTVSNSP